MASLWLITRYDGAGEGNIRYPLALGSIVALAGLTRPLMICLVPVYYCFLVPLWPPAKLLQREAIRRTLFFALPVIVFVLGWCGFNYFNSGYFTPTTRAGQQLMDQVDPYVDLAPDRFAVLRDVWLQSRRQALTSPPTGPLNLFMRTRCRKWKGKRGKQTSRSPMNSLLSPFIWKSIIPFFASGAPNKAGYSSGGNPPEMKSEWPQGGKVRLDEFLMTMANFLVREVEAVFLVLALLSLPCALFRLKAFTKLEYLIFAIALWVSVFAAFTEFGENRRFCVPLYMLIVYTLMTRVWMWIAATSSVGLTEVLPHGPGHPTAVAPRCCRDDTGVPG